LVNELFGRHFGMQLVSVDAADRFFAKLADVSDPETKRKIIGEQFIRVFEEEARKLGRVDYLAQGTIYPDILESAEGAVKAHHNVGGLPEEFDFELVEPVKYLFKDEVRVVGEALGLPHELVWRQPFPGPGLAVRVIGALDRDKVRIVREADAIFREEIARAGLDGEIWQYYAALPGVRSTGVQDGRRTYGHAVVLRAVLSRDALSADVAELPYDLLRRVTLRITSEVEGVNRVMYDTTPKPPGTIEWE
jgi:GMP synthase (glutamine-hydrolysing)